MSSAWRLRFAQLIGALQAVATISLLGVSAWLISRAAEMPSIMYLSLAVVGVRAFAIAKAALRYTDRLLTHDAVFRMLGVDKRNLFEKMVQRLPFGVRSFGRGEALSSVVADLDTAREDQLRFWPAIVQVVTAWIAGAVLQFWLLPSSALATIVIWFFGALVSAFIAWRSAVLTESVVFKHRSVVAKDTLVLLENFKLLSSLGQADAYSERLHQSTSAANRATAKSAWLSGFSQMTLLITAAASIVANAYCASAAQGLGALSRVNMVVLILTQLAILELHLPLPNAISAWWRSRVARASLAKFEQSVGHRFAGNTLGELEEIQVGGEYSVNYGTDRIAAEISSGLIVAGDIVAIAGVSGVGKSSFGLGLAGHLPISGQVKLNGILISEYRRESLTSRFGYLEQQPHVFSNTVRANLSLARDGLTDQEMINVLKEVKLWSIFSDREGLNTTLGDFGEAISGGEATRLSLARLLLANFEVLILDEPTSSLNRDLAEEIVQDIISAAREHRKTAIFISHDSAVLKRCDKIFEVSASR